MFSLFQSLSLFGALPIAVFMTAVFNLILASIIYIHGNRTGNEIFYALIAFFISVWTVATLITSGDSPSLPLLKVTSRLHYIAGQMAYFSFFWYAVFYLRKTLRTALLPILISLINLAASVIVILPFYFYQAVQLAPLLEDRLVFHTTWHLFYTLVLAVTFFTTEVLLAQKHEGAEKMDKSRLTYIIVGTTLGGTLGLLSNVIFPVMGIYFLFPVGPIFVSTFFTGLSIYALLRYKLFDIKVVATEILIFLLWLVILTRTLFAETLSEQLTNGGLLIATVIIGIFLIRSVIKEVRLREEVQSLVQDLRLSNEQQSNLIHFISHEVKGFLAKSRNIFSLFLEGDYGALPEYLKGPSEEGLRSGTKGVEMVMEILNASNFKKGTVEYTMKPFDVKQILFEILADQKKIAEAKGLAFNPHIEENSNYAMTGDVEQIQHALKNLVDNSIKYTPKGSVDVSLSQNAGIIHFSVKDTGVGIDPIDIPHLFTEGVRGKDALKVNVDSTGFGLFIVKKIVEAHKGKIWFESEGVGKGSTFFVELPQKQ